uniref:Uncharacterized protein n=2 Tax=Meloidogyne TaxID=189290 RepID=A0A6V7X1R4_MELEN|nr:unnamed protein product [Meloidogyne enterolobii]
MPLRAQIERWSRNELEEHFHKVSDEVRALKQNNQKMQKEIKIINGRINAGVGIESRAQIKQNNNEYEGLERSNKVLSQKLKVLKHQLLNYSTTTPYQNKAHPNILGSSRPSTAQLPLNTKQKIQQRKTNFGRQRPKSSTIESQKNQNSKIFNDDKLIKNEDNTIEMIDNNSVLPTKICKIKLDNLSQKNKKKRSEKSCKYSKCKFNFDNQEL